MERVELEISLDLNVVCPHCKEWNDLRENDYEIDYFWSKRATRRLSGKEMDINETHECLTCGESFVVNGFSIQ